MRWQGIDQRVPISLSLFSLIYRERERKREKGLSVLPVLCDPDLGNVTLYLLFLKYYYGERKLLSVVRKGEILKKCLVNRYQWEPSGQCVSQRER